MRSTCLCVGRSVRGRQGESRQARRAESTCPIRLSRSEGSFCPLVSPGRSLRAQRDHRELPSRREGVRPESRPASVRGMGARAKARWVGARDNDNHDHVGSVLMLFLLDPFASGFMLRALVGGVLVAALCGAVGTRVVIRGMAFLGEAMAHGLLPGVATAALLGLPPVLGAAVSASVMSAGVG